VNAVNKLDEQFIKTKRQRQLLEKASQLSKKFAERAEYYDKVAAFPFENFDDLKKAGFLSLTVPEKYGGQGITLYDFLLVQEKIAQGDAATALSLGWHLGIIMNLGETKKWDESIFQKLCEEVVRSQKLINSAQSEPRTGSPARGGKPETTAEKSGGKWVINGRKNFTSMAPALDYFIVSATLEDTEEVADFLISRETEGITIEETWDTLGMRGTRSDDLVLTNVVVEEAALVEMKTEKSKQSPQGWLLHIPACYLGIAIAARNYAVYFAKSYQPNSLSHPIKDVQDVRRRIGEMDVELLAARHFMYAVAERWDLQPEIRQKMGPELAAVKYTATNTAIRVVDLAMRVVGGQSLFSSNPLQRFYRDVRAGLYNPPGDDITLSMLAKRAFED
jgi:alkylation response protein AidB-like acyl-CoA dehydrogenase